MSNFSKNDPQNIEQNFDELELVAEKAGELNDRVGKIENELGAQTKTLESAALVLDAAIKGLGALKSSVLENDIGALQLALNDKTAHLAREIGRFESAVAEIDRRAESGDDEIKAALLATAQSLRAQFDAKSLEIGEWSARVEKEIAAHSVALAAIPPIIKGADAVGFNPVGEWETGKAFARMDVVSYAGSSYISNVDGNTEKPSKSKNYTVLSKRAGSIGSGGVGGFAELTGAILPAQVVPGSATYAVGDVLYAGTTGALSKLGAGSSGQLLSTQGAGAAPIWVTATGGAGDMNGPASATDNAIVRFDGTGGKTVQNSAVTIADTTGDIAGASSLTAPTSTALTLTGGSTGASLMLGQGTTAADVTLAYKGTGKVAFNRWVAASATAPAALAAGSGGIYFQANGSVAGTQDSWVFDTGYTDQSYRFKVAGTDKMVIAANTGNLLIGTTTDAASLAGGLVINGSGAGAAASSTTTGALRVTGGVGVSGAGYFGGSLTTGVGSTATLGSDIYGRNDTTDATAKFSRYGVPHYTNAEEPVFVIGGRSDATTNVLSIGGNSTVYNAATATNFYAAANNTTVTGTLIGSITTAGLSILTTTASVGSTSGALQVAGGIYAGAASVFGDTVSLSKTGANILYFNPTNVAATSGRIQWRANGQRAWYAGPNIWSSGQFEIGASTADDGTTFGAPHFAITATTGAATFAGAVTIAGTVIHTLSATPASASATGTVGTMSWDANYVYICTATNTWKRVAIATW